MDAFEDLDVWKRSSALVVSVYSTLRTCKERSLRDQALRSSISIPSNIAEGYERNSDRQFVQFLRIAKGSCGELRTQIHLCHRMGLISAEVSEQLIDEARQVSSMIQGLISCCRRRLEP
jgi:four helix bundle protein